MIIDNERDHKTHINHAHTLCNNCVEQELNWVYFNKQYREKLNTSKNSPQQLAILSWRVFTISLSSANEC